MERFENAIFKQREEINDRMAEMFGPLKERTTSMAPKKLLIREEGGTNRTDTEMPIKEAGEETEAEKGTKNKPIKRAEREETTEASSS
ncbi:hypothetical protein Tco_0956735 [Tanacetum coccineum]